MSTQTARRSRPGRSGRVAGDVRAAVLSAHTGRFWTVDDFPGLDASAVDKALVRLKDTGELVTVRRGLYFRGKQSLFGMARPSQEQLVAAVAGDRGVGPAGLTAANELSLSTQLPGVDVYAVPRPAPRDLPTVRFVSRPSRTGRLAAALSGIEVAVLEVLDSWEGVTDVTPSATADRLVELIDAGQVRAAKLVRASVDEPAAARERLRHVLLLAGLADLSDEVPRARSALARSKALAGLPVLTEATR